MTDRIRLISYLVRAADIQIGDVIPRSDRPDHAAVVIEVETDDVSVYTLADWGDGTTLAMAYAADQLVIVHREPPSDGVVGNAVRSFLAGARS